MFREEVRRRLVQAIEEACHLGVVRTCSDPTPDSRCDHLRYSLAADRPASNHVPVNKPHHHIGSPTDHHRLLQLSPLPPPSRKSPISLFFYSCSNLLQVCIIIAVVNIVRVYAAAGRPCWERCVVVSRPPPSQQFF